MARIASNFDIQLVDSSGNPLSSGTIEFFEAGTATNKNTYPTQADAIALTNANPNPITCDSLGRPYNSGLIDIFLLTDTKYDIVIKDSLGNTVKTIRDYAGSFDPLTAAYTSSDIKFNDNTGIQDSNGNEVIDIVKVANAENYFQFTNGASGVNPQIIVAGPDTNRSVTLVGKGTGGVNINGAYLLPTADGTANYIMATNGAGAVTFTNPSDLFAYPPGYLNGLVVANDTDTDHDLEIGIGACRDEFNTANMIVSSAFTKRIDASWVEGDGNGGLASAVSLSANQNLNYFLISKTDGTCDAGWDTSGNASNLLADATDYTYFRRIMSIRTDSSSNIRPFKQQNAGQDTIFLYDTPYNDVSTTLSTTNQTQFNLGEVPTAGSAAGRALDSRVLCNLEISNTGSACRVYIRNFNLTGDLAPTVSSTNAPGATLSTEAANMSTSQMMWLYLSNSRDGYVRASATNTVFRVFVLGWADDRSDVRY